MPKKIPCKHCKIKIGSEVTGLGFPEGTKIIHTGCKYCNGTGWIRKKGNQK